MLDLCYSPLVRGSRTRGRAQGAGYNIKHRSNICFNLKINTVRKICFILHNVVATYVITPLYAAGTKRCSASSGYQCLLYGIENKYFLITLLMLNLTCAYPLVSNARKLKRDKRAHACAQGTFSYTPCSRRGVTKNICFSANIYVPKNKCFLKKYIYFLKAYIFFVRPLLVHRSWVTYQTPMIEA